MSEVGHNQKTEQEQYQDQQFMIAFTEIKELKSEMAGSKGDMNAVYKRLKDLGWSKKDIEFAFTLADKDVGQVIEDFEHKIRIAKLFGHSLGRRVDLFDEDRAPQTERAYDEGYASGMLRENKSNPYQAGSREASEWQRGVNDGNAQVNKDLSNAMSGNDDDDPFPDDEE